MSSIIENIMAYCIDEDGYGRMFDFKCKGINTEVEDYAAFRMWNITCLAQMSDEDLLWVWGLCKRIGSSTIATMDMEDCILWTADQFFFDKKKRLCIVHPR